MNRNLMGQTFALYYCKAWAEPDNSETTISGLYMVEDVVYPDRTCGQMEGGYWVFPAEYAGSGEGPQYFVDDWTFLEQTNPQSAGRKIEQDRERDFAAEDFEKELGHIFDHEWECPNCGGPEGYPSGHAVGCPLKSEKPF